MTSAVLDSSFYFILFASYLVYALLFVFITRKCFFEKMGVLRSIVVFFISPSMSYAISYVAMVGFIDLIEGSSVREIILKIILSAAVQVTTQIILMLVYMKIVKARNNSIAMFVYLCSVILVPNMLYLAFSNASFIAALIYLALHILFYCLVIKPLSGIQKEKLVTDKRLFAILPVLTYIFNTICYTVFIYQCKLSTYPLESTEFAEAVVRLKKLDPEGVQSIADTLQIFTKNMLLQGDFAIYPTVFMTVILIVAFAIITKNIRYMNETINAHKEVKTLSVEVMEALAHTIDAKDEYTRGHSTRVANYSRMIARKMNLSEKQCDNIYYMGLLHDIGKIGVSNRIINKPGKLTAEEYDEIKKHPLTGYEILSEIKSRPDLATGARWHHERYDGKGYPDGLKGTAIPLEARIIAVADAYDAMTSNRSYRKYLSQDLVRKEIETNINTQFDEIPAKCMLKIIDEDTDYALHE